MRKARIAFVMLWPVNIALVGIAVTQLTAPHIYGEYGLLSFLSCAAVTAAVAMPLYMAAVHHASERALRRFGQPILLPGEFE
jgi:hypothetical protein